MFNGTYRTQVWIKYICSGTVAANSTMFCSKQSGSVEHIKNQKNPLKHMYLYTFLNKTHINAFL